MSTAKHSETTVMSRDGTELFVQTWTPSSNNTTPKAHVLIIHGYLEHSGRYAEVSQALCKQGISVTAFDMRGHGKSSGQRGYVQQWVDYHDDLTSVLQTLDTPVIFVLGHSNGGLLALDYVNNSDSEEVKAIQGVIITSPFLKAADDLGWFRMTLSKILGKLIPKAAVAANVKSTDLTHDEAIAKAHDQDPLVLKDFTLSWASEAMAAQKRVVNRTDFPLPILLVYAGDDKISSMEANEEYAEALQQDDKTVIPRQEEYHEVLNEVNREELHETICKWILKRAA